MIPDHTTFRVSIFREAMRRVVRLSCRGTWPLCDPWRDTIAKITMVQGEDVVIIRPRAHGLTLLTKFYANDFVPIS